METNFTPNSHRSKEEGTSSPAPIIKPNSLEREPKVTKPVVSSVKVKKKSGASKFAENFIASDAGKVKDFVFRDVLIPAMKKTFSDMVNTGIDMLLYGESRRDKRSTNSGSVSYRSYYNDDRREDRNYRERDRRDTIGFEFEDVVIPTAGECEDVIDRMYDIMADYDGIVSVADLNDLLGIKGRYTDNNYGWRNMRNADWVRVRDGYMLRLPKPTALK